MTAELPRPFCKTVGGKTQLLDRILPRIPVSDVLVESGTYCEPFVGGGAVFFALRRAGRIGRAVLADTNPDLIAAYRAVQDDVGGLIRELGQIGANTKENFLRIRALDAKRLSVVGRGARFLYLNKTAFNGLWRVNQSGQHNVPFAGYKNPTICDEEVLRAASVALRNTKIVLGDFADVMSGLKMGDVAYCDPPYFPASATASFTAYGKDGFNALAQARLEDAAGAAAHRGAFVLLSNADVPETRALYGRWALSEVSARRNVNRDGAKRGAVGELLIEAR